jgi:hypothetical protein
VYLAQCQPKASCTRWLGGADPHTPFEIGTHLSREACSHRHTPGTNTAIAASTHTAFCQPQVAPRNPMVSIHTHPQGVHLSTLMRGNRNDHAVLPCMTTRSSAHPPYPPIQDDVSRIPEAIPSTSLLYTPVLLWNATQRLLARPHVNRTKGHAHTGSHRCPPMPYSLGSGRTDTQGPQHNNTSASTRRQVESAHAHTVAPLHRVPLPSTDQQHVLGALSLLARNMPLLCCLLWQENSCYTPTQDQVHYSCETHR